MTLFLLLFSLLWFWPGVLSSCVFCGGFYATCSWLWLGKLKFQSSVFLLRCFCMILRFWGATHRAYIYVFVLVCSPGLLVRALLIYYLYSRWFAFPYWYASWRPQNMSCVSFFSSTDYPCSSTTTYVFLFYLWGEHAPTTTIKDHTWLDLPDFRAPSHIYISPHPSAPIHAHHGHVWASLTLSWSMSHFTHFTMSCLTLLRACLVCLCACFGVFSMCTCPNPNPEHLNLL